MSLEVELQKYPKEVKLKDNSKVKLRPLKRADEKDFHALFLTIPEAERMFIKHRVTDITVIHGWCENIDLGRNLPLLAVGNGKILGVATLHQQLGGWKRHIGRVSVLVQPSVRGRGVARALVQEIVDIARATGLEKVEAEFIGGQDTAIHMFAMLGFSELLRLEEYVKDMTANSHDYVLMGLDLKTDEEYASAERMNSLRNAERGARNVNPLAKDSSNSVASTLPAELRTWKMPPAICPHCGNRVPSQAKACPECGADESTGWSEAARADELDLPDGDFDYEEFAKHEFGGASALPKGVHWFWWVVALLLLAGLLLLWLR